MFRAFTAFARRVAIGSLGRAGLLAIAAGMLAMLGACDAPPPCDGATLDHPAGFSVCRDRGVVQVVKLDDGFQFLLKPAREGNSDEITVRATSADPHTAGWKEKAFNGRPFWWSEQTVSSAASRAGSGSGSGSGKDEQTLSIYVPIGPPNVLVIRRVKSSDKLDADSTWNVARSVKPLATKR